MKEEVTFRSIYKKHFGDVPSVPITHPSIHAFNDELIEAGMKIGHGLKPVREFFYYSDPALPNRVSVCGIYEGGQIKFSAARLSDSDRFVKKIGRDKARGRALSHPIAIIPAEEDKVIKAFNQKAKEIAAKVRLTPAFQKQEYLFNS